MLAIKENKEYTITEADIKSFQAEGYDIIDDNGNLLAYGAGKSVSMSKYAEAVERAERYADEVIALKDELEKANDEIAELKKELAKKPKTTKTAKKEDKAEE